MLMQLDIRVFVHVNVLLERTVNRCYEASDSLCTDSDRRCCTRSEFREWLRTYMIAE